jgi:hypothetical protein
MWKIFENVFFFGKNEGKRGHLDSKIFLQWQSFHRTHRWRLVLQQMEFQKSQIKES